jgi:hypothetical protein
MKDPLYRFSAATVSFARLLEAVFNLGLALVLALIALRLSLSFGFNWLIVALDVILGLSAVQLFVKACTIYSTSRLPDRPDVWERYLRSRSLYVPEDGRDARRRERGA